MEIFYDDVKKFAAVCIQYSRENVKNHGTVTDNKIKEILDKSFGKKFGLHNIEYLDIEVNNRIPKEILKALYSLVQSFMRIWDTHGKACIEDTKDKKFVSGMRFVYNITKHQEKRYNITDLIVPDFNIESDVCLVNNDGSMLVPIEDLDFKLGAKWVFASKELFKDARPNQIQNYNRLFKGKDVIDTVVEAVHIIEKYKVQNKENTCD